MTGWIARHAQALLFAAGRLTRAPFASTFTVLVIAIAMTLPATFGLAIDSLRGVTGSFANAVDVTVYFKRDVALEKVQQLATATRARSGVASVKVVPADEALEAFRQDSGFGTALNALEGNPLPHAMDVRPTAEAATPADLESLKQHLSAWPEVDLVQVDSEWVHRLNAIVDLAQRLVLGLAVLLGLGVAAVIINTIRLEIYNRRAEIEVTKLVGGSNAFVRRPFLYTGLFYGGLGGVLAVVLVTLIGWLLADPVHRLASSYGSDFALARLDLEKTGLLVGAGALIGLVAAYISASRHLAKIEPRA